MTYDKNGEGIWSRLKAKHDQVLLKVEDYAALTVPSVYHNDHTGDIEQDDQTIDYQSLGAIAVNHLVNKLALAMFAPSRPFFRIDSDAKTKGQLQQMGVPKSEVVKSFAPLEREAVSVLDGSGHRPKLYQALTHIVVAGNVLLDLSDKIPRVMGLKYFAVKRNARGVVHCACIREEVLFDELDEAVQKLPSLANKYKEDDRVQFYRTITLAGGKYTVKQYVCNVDLGDEYTSVYEESKLPYHFITWVLEDGSDYGVGLVEQYSRDLTAMSEMSRGVLEGSMAGMEVKWFLNPTSQSTSDQVAKSENGAVLSGLATDLTAVTADNSRSIERGEVALARYEQRISRAFLLGSGVTRQAERVTAEEIRAQAQELETSYGGVYSALAAAFQRPLAIWLLKQAGIDLGPLNVTVTTGLEALSRGADLDNFRLALNDLSLMAQLPPQLQQRLNPAAVYAFVGAGRGVDLTDLLLSEEQVQANEQAAQQARVAEATATASGEAGAQIAVNQQAQ